MARFRRAAGERAGSDRSGHRRAGSIRARSRAHLCDRRQRRDLLRPRRHRTRARLDDGDGHRQPRDGDGQHRPRRRRRESAARPEQRAGFVRHGLVPARTAGLSPHQRHGHAHAVRRSLERHAATGTGPAHSEHVRRRRARHLQGSVLPGRRHRAVGSEHAARVGGAVVDGMHRRAGHFPERDRQVCARAAARFVVPRKGRHVHQRGAPHLARAQGHAAGAGLRRLGSHDAARARARL